MSRQETAIPRGSTHIFLLMGGGGGPRGSILGLKFSDKREFFGSMKDAGIFFGSQKKIIPGIFLVIV